MAAPEREVLLGGAAGGSKTYSLIADPLRYFGNPNCNGLLLRRTNDELREIVGACQKLYPQAYKVAKRFRSCDFGYSSFSAVLWFEVDPAFGTLFVYRELYVSKHTGRDFARAIKEAEEGEKVPYGVLDPSC